MTERRMPWKWIAVVWVVATVIAGLAGFGLGYITGPEPGPLLPSAEQQEILDGFGSPPAFFVGDGPLDQDARWHRVEVWSYPEHGTDYEFLDGALVDERASATSATVASTSVSPADLGRERTKADVEELLGEEGTPLDRTDGMWEDLDPVLYPSARLAVGYLNGRVYVAETL